MTQRTVNANDGVGPHIWTYTYTFGRPSTTTVTDPMGITSSTRLVLGLALDTKLKRSITRVVEPC